MNSNLELHLMMHREKLFEVERLNQRHLRIQRKQPKERTQNRAKRFTLRRLLSFL